MPRSGSDDQVHGPDVFRLSEACSMHRLSASGLSLQASMLGGRIKRLREEAGESQEDMLSHGYSVRCWQKVEAGKPITLRTLLRICRIFSTPMCDVVRGLDRKPKTGSRRSR